MRQDPYEYLPPVPAFRIESEDVLDGEPMPRSTASEGAGGANESPHLTWSGFPPETRSFVVTMFDADAPTPSGFWHWVVKDIPAWVTELGTTAGSNGDDGLPAGASHLRNDAGERKYLGPAPPPGHGAHRFFIAVSALDVESVGVPDDASPAYLSFLLLGHVLGRAIMVPWFESAAITDDRRTNDAV